MVRYYDNWERLVEAVMRREQLRQLSLSDSRTPSVRSYDSDWSCSSSSRHENLSFGSAPSPLHSDAVKLKLAQSLKQGKQKVPAKRRYAVWKGLSIFSGFSTKKDYGREEREVQWDKAQRTFHGLEPVKSDDGLYSKQKNEEVSRTAEDGKMKAEIARFREAHTLKGHIESVMKTKGIDIDQIHHYYTI